MSYWNEEREAELRRLFTEGKSGSEIAALMTDTFGVEITRNAIIGKRIRMGLTFSKPKAPPKTVTPKRDRSGDIAFLNRRRAGSPIRRKRGPKSRKEKAAECHQGVSFDALQAGMCRWPEGEGDHMNFCGCKTNGETYCPEHTAVAYRKHIPKRLRFEEAA